MLLKGFYIRGVNDTGVVSTIPWKYGIFSSKFNGSEEQVRRNKLTNNKNGAGRGGDDLKGDGAGAAENYSLRMTAVVREYHQLSETVTSLNPENDELKTKIDEMGAAELCLSEDNS